MRRSSPVRGFLLATTWLVVAAPAASDPTLDVDNREIWTETDPPFSTPAQSAMPAAFAPFSRLVTQGGSTPCGMLPSNASSSAQQDSTVAPFAYAGSGSVSYSITPGSCSSAAVDQWSLYEIIFTTDTDYVFDLDADLVNASLLIDPFEDNPPFASVTDFTGNLAITDTMPPDTYIIRVEAAFFEVASAGGPSSADSGSYDFTLSLPEPSGTAGLACGLGLLTVLGRLRGRARPRRVAPLSRACLLDVRPR